MKFLCNFSLWVFLFMSVASGELVLPADISKGISQGVRGESGGFWVEGIDENQFKEYLVKNWREIADNIESLPPGVPDNGGTFPSEEPAAEYSKANFGGACEVLSAPEYMDFLEKWLALFEAKRITFETFKGTISLWSKQSFLAVNWEHPRVQTFLLRVLQQTSESPSK